VQPEPAGRTYVVGDVTSLPAAGLGHLAFFLDIGCFQGLDAGQRRAAGAGILVLADPGATVLVLAFGPSRYRRMVGGVSRDELMTAFPVWEMLAVEAAETAGLGWPMNRTKPQWYRLRRSASA
jgi:hypothetical protein